MDAPKPSVIETWKAFFLQCATNSPGIEHLRDYVVNTRDFDPIILDPILPFIDPRRLPSKKIQSHLRHKAASEILRNVEQARLSIEVITSLCRAFPHDPDGEDVAHKEELTKKLLPNLETLVEWADILCLAGYVETSARLLFELWRYHPTFPPKFRNSTPVADVLFSLWVARDRPTDGHVFSSGGGVCPLISLFLLLSLDEESRDMVQTALAKKSNDQIVAILHTFRQRMEETVRLHGEGKLSREFSVKHLARLGKLLHFIIPSDTRRYWGRFLLREGLLKTLFESVLSLMPIHQADTCWTDVISAVQLVSRFVLEAGEYSANPISKMAAAVSGGVVPLLLGAIVHLDSSDTVTYDAALALLSLIGPYFVYRQVWDAARPYFPQYRVELLQKSIFEKLTAEAQMVWRSVELSYHNASRCHTGGTAKRLTTFGCDNVNHDRCTDAPTAQSQQCSHCHTVLYCSRKCQREDWELHHRQECPLLFPIYWSRQLNQWLPGYAKADVLAFVEDFWNYRFDVVKHAEAVLEIPTNSHYVGKLIIDALPPKLSLVPAPAYTEPSCKNPAFNSRMKTYTKEFLLKARHQLVEIRFSFGNSLHRALIDLQLTDKGAWKVNSGAFGF